MFKIQTPIGFVHKYSAAQQMVQVTDEAGAKKFKTREAAEQFLSTYADAGLGLKSTSAVIVEVK